MRIEVTQDHIDHGEIEAMGKCAVALALREQVDDRIRVGLELKVSPTMRPVWKWPAKVYKFISDFDGGLKVKPMNFTLPENVVKQIKELGGNDEPKTKTKHQRKVKRSRKQPE